MALGTSIFKQDFTSFDTSGATVLSRGKFNLTIGLCLLWGLAVNAIICLAFGEAIVNWVVTSGTNYLILVVAYVVLAIAGITINTRSDKPAISFLGYNLVVLPLGAILSILIAMYPVLTVGYAFATTAAVTAVMIIVSTVFPNFFLSIGRVLFGSLLICIIAELLCSFLMPGALGIFDWIVALIFCGYIGFDYARAQRVPPTLDNAIDCACALYLDIINLFIRLLEIFGRRN